MGGSRLWQLGHSITGVLISSGLLYGCFKHIHVSGKLTQTYDSTRTCATRKHYETGASVDSSTPENIMKLWPNLIRRHLVVSNELKSNVGSSCSLIVIFVRADMASML